jgi:hypothetical protein
MRNDTMKREILAASLATLPFAAPFVAASASEPDEPQWKRGSPGTEATPGQTAPGAAPEGTPRTDHPAGTTMPGGKRESRTLMSGEGLAAGDLRGKTVFDRRNDEAGTVTAIRSSADGNPKAAIVHIGGLFGIGSKRVAVPVQQLRVTSDGRLVVNLTEDELNQLPEVADTRKDRL